MPVLGDGRLYLEPRDAPAQVEPGDLVDEVGACANAQRIGVGATSAAIAARPRAIAATGRVNAERSNGCLILALPCPTLEQHQNAEIHGWGTLMGYNPGHGPLHNR